MTDKVFRWSSAAMTHKGKVREVNEDALLDLPERGLWVVADGMGGHEAGDVASRMIVDALGDVNRHDNPADFLDDVEDRLLDVNLNLFEAGAMSTAARTMGSTVIALLAFGDHCIVIWAGDSRAYRLRSGEFRQLTVDHSQVEEMVQTGEIRRDQAEDHPLANVITRAVGGTEELQLDLELFRIADGDRFLLCSDGVYKDLDEAAIAAALADGDATEACEALLRTVLDGPASDNATVAVIDFRSGS